MYHRLDFCCPMENILVQNYVSIISLYDLLPFSHVFGHFISLSRTLCTYQSGVNVCELTHHQNHGNKNTNNNKKETNAKLHAS